MFLNCIASLKVLLLFLWLCLFYPPVWLIVKFKKTALRDSLVVIFNKGLLKIIGIRVKVTGTLSDARPLLLITNHISYLDIPVLASINAICFTPKSEISGWPVVGSISRLSGAVFVDRRKEKVVEVKQELEGALKANRILCLFPESTTGNGMHLQPFKSGLFSIADEDIDGKKLTIQPAGITYTHIRGLPISSDQWPYVAWYGDMDLAPHAWELLKLGSITAELHFLPETTLQACGDRKKLAAHCRKGIVETVQTLRIGNFETHAKNQLPPRFGKFSRALPKKHTQAPN